MSQDVDRQKVLQTTKVRTAFKDDLSWIHKSKKAAEEGSNESAEPAEEAKTSSLRQLSYVLSTAKKFESTESPPSPKEQKAPAEVPGTSDNGLQNGNGIHSEPLSPEPTNDKPTAASSTEEKNDVESSKSNEQHCEESAEVSTNVEVIDVATTLAEIETEHNNDVGEVSTDHTAEDTPVNGCSANTEPTNVISLLKAGGELAEQPEKENGEESLSTDDTKTVVTSADAPVEPEPISVTAPKEEAGVSVVPDILVESVYKSPSPQENANGCSKAKVLDILSDSLIAPLLNIESKKAEVNPVSDLLAGQLASEPAAETVITHKTPDEDTIAPNNVEAATRQAAEETVKATSESSDILPDAPQDNTETQTTEQTSTKEDTVESETTNAEVTVVENSVASNGEETDQGTTESAPSETKEEVCVDQTSTDQESKSEDAVDPAPTCPTVSTVAESPTEAASNEPAPVCSIEAVVATSEIATVLSENTETTGSESAKTVEETETVVETLPDKEVVSDGPKEVECPVNETTATNPKAKTESGEEPSAESSGDSNTVETQTTAETPAVTTQTSAETPSVTLEENVKGNIEECVESVVQSTSQCPDQTPAQPETDQDEMFKAVPVVVSSSELPEPEVEENSPTNDAAPVEETIGDSAKDTVPETTAEPVQAEAKVEPPPVVAAVASVNQAALELDDALETTPNGEQSKEDAGTVELADALDEVPVDKSVKESEEPKDSSVDQKPIDNNNSAQSSAKKEEASSTSYIMRDGKEVCSLCDEFIGLAKLTLTYPQMYLHPDCLKCGMCTKILGDLLSPMFEHNQLIYCNHCYDKLYSLG